MRRFLVLAHTQPPRGPIPLEDAPGAGGRWDVLARCVTAGLLVSHGLRADTEVLLWLSRGPRLVKVLGQRVRRLNPDERSTLALLGRALQAHDVGAHETEEHDGIVTAQWTLEETLSACARNGAVVWLKEDGPTPLEDWSQERSDVTFVLSDHRDPTPEEAALLARHATSTCTLGPVAIQADQCIVVVHNRLDRQEIRRNPSG